MWRRIRSTSTRLSFNGRLYLVHHYPGVVDSAVTDDRVHGELYRVHSGAAFAILDEYEGCGPNVPQPAEYVRVQRSVVRANGTVVTAWIYLYNHPVERLPLIPSGRFLPPNSSISRGSHEIDLSSRAAIVTGGSKGLGWRVATRFAASGADVVIAGRGREALDAAVASIKKVAKGKIVARAGRCRCRRRREAHL